MDIKKAIELYELMAKRFESSRFGQEQAKVYRETIEFMRDCKTAEEASIKIKDSKYYTAPAIAMAIDKASAREMAAKDDNILDVAKVYTDKKAEIAADESKAYQNTHEAKANNLRINYNEKLATFSNIYNTYYDLITSPSITADLEEKQEKLKEEFNKLKNLGGDFNQLSKEENFKNLVPGNKKGYENFIEKAPLYCDQIPEFIISQEEVMNQAKEAYEKIKTLKSELIAVGEECFATAKNGAAIAIPPSDDKGKYKFDYISEENYNG